MKIENASVDWLDSGLPYSIRFGDIYYSKDDALGESQHVFIAANKLAERWQQAGSGCRSFTIAELGFGSGLNFLQAWKLWRTCKKRPRQLHYLGFEKHPLSYRSLEKIHALWPQLRSLSRQLLHQYSEHSGGCHRLCLEDGVYLDLYYGDALSQLASRHRSRYTTVDCWFLDGFSPRVNPDLWEPELLQLVASNSHPGTSLTTYSVAGAVRKNLQAAGFDVKKLPGHRNKRHMLLATLSASAPTTAAEPTVLIEPWFELPTFTTKQRSALIIGAGLAGCSMAYSLAQRDWRVTIVDRAKRPAAGASGNRQLALRCRLYKTHSPLAEYFLHCFLFAAGQFDALSQTADAGWHACGVLQLPSALNRRNGVNAADLRALYPAQVIQALSRSETDKQAGVAMSSAGWHLARGGWVDPQALCQAYLAHPAIDCRYEVSIERIEQSQDNWLAQEVDHRADPIAAEVIVICNGHDALQFNQAVALPLTAVRGQVTEIDASHKSKLIRSVLCGERTVFPAYDNHHVVAASYTTNDCSLHSSEIDNSTNLNIAASEFADSDLLNPSVTGDRVSYRCNAADFVPVVGLLPNIPRMQNQYADLARNAKSSFAMPGSYHRGLFINVAHGSNGLASCPLSSEYLASLINNEPGPLGHAQMNCLNPARFLIRNLKKQR